MVVARSKCRRMGVEQRSKRSPIVVVTSSLKDGGIYSGDVRTATPANARRADEVSYVCLMYTTSAYRPNWSDVTTAGACIVPSTRWCYTGRCSTPDCNGAYTRPHRTNATDHEHRNCEPSYVLRDVNLTISSLHLSPLYIGFYFNL